MVGMTKHITFKEETAVCIPCKNNSFQYTFKIQLFPKPSTFLFLHKIYCAFITATMAAAYRAG